ncbi:hypothetical protein SEPCBS57363_004709 [Sporothrix epigloea]|uniref:Uncharacterized protein n=1 Tax=Sporothrix epigloea TaxID=1892477 RepID=A0ABP0DTG9_9PEZI
MSDTTEISSTTTRKAASPYDYPRWIEFSETMSTDVSALSGRDFGSELNTMIMEDKEIDPNLPPDDLTKSTGDLDVTPQLSTSASCDQIEVPCKWLEGKKRIWHTMHTHWTVVADARVF